MPSVVNDIYRWVITAETTIFQNGLSNRLPRDEALEKEDRTEMKKRKQPTVPHLLQTLPYAKVVGHPCTGSYPAPSPDPTTHSPFMVYKGFNNTWTASSEFGTYRLCEQRRFRRACASVQSRQNLRCLLIQAVSLEEPSDRKPDPWPLWMAGHAQLKFVTTECSKTQIRLTGPTYILTSCKYSHIFSRRSSKFHLWCAEIGTQWGTLYIISSSCG